MACAVAEVIDAGGVLAVEAGTGVGKTFAYLVPLLLSGRRALLSTATQALQDQLVTRDIPALTAWLARPVRVAMLKGRSSYVCVQRLDQTRRGELAAGWQDPALGAALEGVFHWAQHSAAGDLAELGGLAEASPLRPWITSTRDNCLGQACPRLSDCHVNRARRLAGEADWVVVNHHLLLADHRLQADALEGLLPTVDVVVLDEAHRVHEIAWELLGRSLGARDLHSLARELTSQGERWARGLQPWAHWALVLGQGARDLARLLGRGLAPGSRVTWCHAAPDGLDPAQWQRSCASLWLTLAEVARALEATADAAEPLRRLLAHTQALRGAWHALVNTGLAAATDSIRWIDLGQAQGDWRLHASPADLAARFRELMGARGDAQSWVFTSATLGTDAALHWFTEPLGLDGDPRLRCLRLPSPLDHARQAQLYVPQDLPDTTDPAHSAALAEAVAGWAARLGGRTLVLTTSLRAVSVIGETVRRCVAQGRCAPLQVFAQGQMSKRALLAGFRSAGAGDGPGAVLVASASFWEGVDLPGEVLQLLVIDKLPFPPPDDPLIAGPAQRVEAQGGSVFRRCHLPSAIMALQQGAGRLIRSDSDRGVLVIGDRRLLTRSYGPEMLAALPAMGWIESESGMATALDGLRRR